MEPLNFKHVLEYKQTQVYRENLSDDLKNDSGMIDITDFVLGSMLYGNLFSESEEKNDTREINITRRCN